MKAPFLVVVIVMLHVLVVGGVLFIQGCGTTHQDAPEPPPVPVMPESGQPTARRPQKPVERFTPPAPVRDTAPVARDIKTYTVKSGDILSRIANKFGVSVRELSELNGITNPNMIRVGQELVLPAYAKEPKPTMDTSAEPSSKPAEKPAASEVEPGGIYEVVSGDVLSRIAARHDTTVKKIMALNNLDSTKIIVGQKLRMPAGATDGAADDSRSSSASEPEVIDAPEVEPEPESVEVEEEVEIQDADEGGESERDEGVASLFSSQEPYKYTVAEGETVMQIAKDYIVDPRELRELNNLGDNEEVKPGQQILIPMSDL